MRQLRKVVGLSGTKFAEIAGLGVYKVAAHDKKLAPWPRERAQVALAKLARHLQTSIAQLAKTREMLGIPEEQTEPA